MGCRFPQLPEFSLRPDNAKLEVLRSQERIRFRYMLDGFDKT